jgi:hypothetical protein
VAGQVLHVGAAGVLIDEAINRRFSIRGAIVAPQSRTDDGSH